jgi:hypothetical protein
VSANFDVEVAMEALLQQVMNAGISQAYPNERVASADASTKGASHMSCYVEPRALTALTEPEVDTLNHIPTS